MQDSPLKVVIVGGGVAALEALIALRELAEERVSLQLVTPDAEFAYRPLAVAEPFGLGEQRRYDYAERRAARDPLGGARHRRGSTRARRLRQLAEGRQQQYVRSLVTACSTRRSREIIRRVMRHA